jgi:hypothetical protein
MELRAAVVKVVVEHHGAGIGEIVQTVSRHLGFKATSATLRAVIQKQVEHLQSSGSLADQGGVLRVVSKDVN